MFAYECGGNHNLLLETVCKNEELYSSLTWSTHLFFNRGQDGRGGLRLGSISVWGVQYRAQHAGVLCVKELVWYWHYFCEPNNRTKSYSRWTVQGYCHASVYWSNQLKQILYNDRLSGKMTLKNHGLALFRWHNTNQSALSTFSIDCRDAIIVRHNI